MESLGTWAHHSPPHHLPTHFLDVETHCGKRFLFLTKLTGTNAFLRLSRWPWWIFSANQRWMFQIYWSANYGHIQNYDKHLLVCANMDPFRLLMLSIENLLIHVKCQVPNMSRCQMSCGKINSFKMSVETTDPWCQMSLVRCQMSLVNVPSMQHSGKRPLNLSHKIDEAFLSKWSSLSRFTIISHQIYIYIYTYIYI